ncbi:MAG TPA: carbamoyltransferase C-terminal domain-containing protein [Vicinamibacterales bacterium]|nr:carbamoyltransferase C-terminal domain-containing protein [Vicinamibacterales bacterium]
MITVGISGGIRSGTAAMAEGGRLVGVCSQERVTRVRGAGVNANGVPDEAIDLLLQRLGRTREHIGRYVSVDGHPAGWAGKAVERVDHHLAHACTAYLTSPFTTAAIVVCDHEAPAISVWRGVGAAIESIDWPWQGPGFADVYSRTASAFGFRVAAADQRLEALARLRPVSRDAEIDGLVGLDADGLIVDEGFERHIADRLSGDRDPGSPMRAALASAVQARLGELLIEFLGRVRNRLGIRDLCVGGNLFYHSSINTLVKQCGLFDQVFVPVDPGNSGLAVGAVLHAVGTGPVAVSPFLGPAYSANETKELLDNCKLQYSWESAEGAVAQTVAALREGRLVGWYDGLMEWGPRALGARCILASPMSPYVLENLNHFLKRREPWRGYALSGLQDAVAEHFEGPDKSPFMECDYRPRDVARFRPVLPSAEAAVRVQAVSAGDGPPLFRRVLEAFGEATGLPFLVNTSFNGFHEPIVCSPRDAVRVFYGSGLDVLMIDQFMVRK